MEYNFIIIRTNKGGIYARKIGSSIKWLNKNVYGRHKFNFTSLTIDEFMESYEDGMFSPLGNYKPDNTIIHPRCANPDAEWINYLKELEKRGFKVVNSTDCITLTSNKLACSFKLVDKVNHPYTWEYRKNMTPKGFNYLLENIIESQFKMIIAKPQTSINQGANVIKIDLSKYEDIALDGAREIRAALDKVPGKSVVIQECIPYTALHRVIVIGGKALPYTFVDYVNNPRKIDWKVSCCLNRITMELHINPSLRLLQLAEQTQKEVGGVINFIDIFEYPWGDNDGQIRDMYGNFTISEINTACSLNIHEKLAKKGGMKDWNIHNRIARQLVKELLG